MRTAGLAALALALSAVLPPGSGASGGRGAETFTLAVTGGDGPNEISIALSRDRSEYLIRANGPVPPVDDCVNPPEDPNELRCPASRIAAFLVRGRGGNDTIAVAGPVPRSAILNGGAGDDDVIGGANGDRLLGGPGEDRLVGRGGADSLYGGAGSDLLLGRPGNDVLRGGGGEDLLFGGPGRDDERF